MVTNFFDYSAPLRGDVYLQNDDGVLVQQRMVSRNRNGRALCTYDQRNKLKKQIINPNINFMKRPNLLLDLMGASLLVFALTSCSESEKKNPVPAEIQKSLLMTALNSNPELSKFTEAFQTLDLSSSQATGLTILALKNDAIGEEGLSSELLKRHILEASYTPSQLSEQSTVTSFGGLELVVKTTEGLVALNNTPIGLQLTVGNSMLYSLDKPIPSYNTYLGLGTDFTVGKSRVLRAASGDDRPRRRHVRVDAGIRRTDHHDLQ